MQFTNPKEVLQTMTNEPTQHTDEVSPKDEIAWEASDIVWGLTNIGRDAGGKTVKEMGYLLKHTRLFDGIVKRISHKNYIASRRLLRNAALTARPRD